MTNHLSRIANQVFSLKFSKNPVHTENHKNIAFSHRKNFMYGSKNILQFLEFLMRLCLVHSKLWKFFRSEKPLVITYFFISSISKNIYSRSIHQEISYWLSVLDKCRASNFGYWLFNKLLNNNWKSSHTLFKLEWNSAKNFLWKRETSES